MHVIHWYNLHEVLAKRMHLTSSSGRSPVWHLDPFLGPLLQPAHGVIGDSRMVLEVPHPHAPVLQAARVELC